MKNRFLLSFAIAACLLPACGCREQAKNKANPDATKTDSKKVDETKESSGKADDAKKPAVTDAAATDAAAADAGKSDDAQTTTPTKPPVDAAEEQIDKAVKAGKIVLGTGELTSGIPGEGALTIEQIETWLADPKNHEVLEFELPMGMAAGASQVKGLDKNPLTRAKIELGRQLYFDPRLSADSKIACATCHNPDKGYAADTQFGVGIGGQQGGRNSPVAYNRILSDKQFWDGRADSLEDQAIGPIQNPIEMGNTHEACVECIKGIKAYKLQFDKIFGDVTIENVGKALASFERAIVTGPSPHDYHEVWAQMSKLDEDDLKDDPELAAKHQQAKADAESHPMTEEAIRGREIFFSTKGNCTACHVGANFTDEKYHNIGIGMDKPEVDAGREVVTKDPKDHGAFKTPTIRNVDLSGPYMHDGATKTLEDVVEWYAKGGHPNPNLSDKIKKLDLTDQDKKDLVAFMKACTGPLPKVERHRIPE